MSKKLRIIALAAISICPAVGWADDTDKSMFSFKGFGTLGVVHSSEHGADVVGSVFQPNGAGRTQDWSSGVDSNLGGQVNAVFNDKFSAIVQAVAQHQYDNSYRPMIEWANVKYQIIPEVSVRVGRIVLPSFLYSESRFVGYANPWIRPPQEVYFVSAITSNDGADVTYRSQFGAVANTAQAYYGNSTAKIPGGKVKSKPSWGFNDTVEIDSLTLRAGYISVKLDLELPSLDPLMSGLDQFSAAATSFGFTQAGLQAQHLSDKYSLTGMQLHFYTLGASYDPGEWFAIAELVKFDGAGILLSSKSGYATAGYRIQKFTPYITFSQIKSDKNVEDGISSAGLPGAFATGAAGLTAGVNAISTTAPSQKSASVGVRWDFMPSADLKIQYDRISLDSNNNGRLANAEPGFVGGGKVNLISAAVDFVF